MTFKPRFLAALALSVALPAPALAIGVCDFLSGDARSLCRAAEQAAKEKRKKKTAEAEAQTPATPKPATRGKSAVATAPANPDVYRSEKFYGINTWSDAFAKAVNDPAGFRTFLDGMVKSANGTAAQVNALATGPKRNFYQKFLTDYQEYTSVFRSRTNLFEKAKQCAIPRDYTPAEACDCVAEFPGDTLIGPGAGELVTGSNSAIGVKACGRAAETATDLATKARYIAQRARAQMYTMDTYQAIQWADEAIRLGYRRAAIVKASGALRDFEFRNGAFPPPSAAENKDIIEIGRKYLAEAQRAGIKEVYVVAQQYRQAIAAYKFNVGFYTPLFKSMTAPPPASKGNDNCQLRPAGMNGAGGIVYGMSC